LVAFIDGAVEEEDEGSDFAPPANSERVESSGATNEALNGMALAAVTEVHAVEFLHPQLRRPMAPPGRRAPSAGRVRQSTTQTQRAARRVPTPYSTGKAVAQRHQASLGEIQISLALTGL
jgi:hypothetical protein